MNDRVGIITVSDRASRGEYEDLGGPAVQKYLEDVLEGTFEPVRVIVPDDIQAIHQSIQNLADFEQCCLIITTGGTGPAPRDVTPEATELACNKLLPGFGELMRAVSLTKVATAILSRQTAGIRGQSLVINLPGQPRAIAECLDAVFPAVPYCIELIRGKPLRTNDSRFTAFYPKK